MEDLIICSPLRVVRSKTKFFILNLNHYRNAHYHTLNKAKSEYLLAVEEQIKNLPTYEQVRLSYTLYPENRMKCDLDNVLAIHAKFFQDVLVTLGRIPEDNYKHVLSSCQYFGEVDKTNPRVEIKIERVLWTLF